MDAYELLALLKKTAKDRSRSLDLRSFDLTDLPPEIGDLTDLTDLDLGFNQLVMFPPELGRLENLTRLSLAGNQLSGLSPEIGRLRNLRVLDLRGNRLTRLPPEVGGLTNLVSLNLFANELAEVPGEIGNLRNLIRLDLGRNRLISLPPELVRSLAPRKICWDQGFSEGSEGVNLYENPLASPPVEIVKRGAEAVENYFHQVMEERHTRLYEAKLLLVGEGGVGKTSLSKKLMDDPLVDPYATRGIDVHEWHVTTPRVKDFRVNVWDFGGQEIYHATHQFFLTKRSLYLLVWDPRKDDMLWRSDYWLNTVKLLSDSAPVFVVMNKADGCTNSIDEAMILRKFTNIKGFFKVSARTGAGIPELRTAILEQLDRLPHVGDILPKVWMAVREELESGCKYKYYITYEDYLALCAGHKLTRDQADNLSRYYHDLGVFLNFEAPPILKNIVFLKPDWATGAMYCILNNREIFETQGRLSFAQFARIWHEYPIALHLPLLELMKKFELVFELSNRREYIVPELLAAGLPKSFSWDESDNLRFEYRYDFMPAGMITRFITRTQSMHKDALYWKNGVVLEWKKTEALIVSEPLNRKIRLSLRGRDKRGLLAIIRGEFDQIHATLNYPEVQELLPCFCPECRVAETPYYFSLDWVMRALDKGQTTLQCNNSFTDIYLHALLGEYGLSGLSPEFQIDESLQIHSDSINRGNIYFHSGQVGAMGRNAQVSANTFHENSYIKTGPMDVYVNKGQVGAMGDGAKAEGNTFNQTVHVGDKNVKIDKSVQVGDRAGRDIVKGDKKVSRIKKIIKRIKKIHKGDIVHGDKIVIKNSPEAVGKGGAVTGPETVGFDLPDKGPESPFTALVAEMERLRGQLMELDDKPGVYYAGKVILAANKEDGESLVAQIKEGNLGRLAPALVADKPVFSSFLTRAGGASQPVPSSPETREG